MFNYAEIFRDQLDQLYQAESKTATLAGGSLNFVNGNIVKVPTVAVPGYKNHNRTGG